MGRNTQTILVRSGELRSGPDGLLSDLGYVSRHKIADMESLTGTPAPSRLTQSSIVSSSTPISRRASSVATTPPMVPLQFFRILCFAVSLKAILLR